MSTVSFTSTTRGTNVPIGLESVKSFPKASFTTKVINLSHALLQVMTDPLTIDMVNIATAIPSVVNCPISTFLGAGITLALLDSDSYKNSRIFSFLFLTEDRDSNEKMIQQRLIRDTAHSVAGLAASSYLFHPMSSNSFRIVPIELLQTPLAFVMGARAAGTAYFFARECLANHSAAKDYADGFLKSPK